MIGYLNGKIQIVRNGWVIVNVEGVGYKVLVSSGLLTKLYQDENAELYIYSHVREDQFSLYGFETVDGLEFFELLISVSGIGPKAALNILDAAPIDKIKTSIVRQDPTLVSSVSGIGKKTAEKLVIELKNKLGGTTGYFEASGKAEDVYGALLQLGFKAHEAQKAIAVLPDDCLGTEERLKFCLNNLHRVTKQ